MESLDLELATPSFDIQPAEPPPIDTHERLLRLSLSSQDDALLPLEQITEILTVEMADLLPVPEMPDCVLGICNWRGEMLWLVDFHHLVGYSSPLQQESCLITVLVVQVNHQLIGLGVQQVKDIELHDLQLLQPAIPGLFPTQLLPFVAGLLPGWSDPVLNIQAIAQCSLWKNHQGGGA